MLEKLQEVESRFFELDRWLSDPNIISNQQQFRKYSQERAELQPIIECFRQWKKSTKDLQDSKDLLENEKDEELRAMASADVEHLREEGERFRQNLMILLLPKDPNDKKNVILELRAGAGGDESALFVSDLFGMYSRFAEARKWRVEIMSLSDSSAGGYKELIARIDGDCVYSVMKYESGVHRVQRVPQTEAQGRIHTSTVTVAVLPEAEEVEVDIAEKDLRIDVYRSSGPGGQSVNTTDSAVRITHISSGLVVCCQDEKSQHKNKAKALTILRTRLLDSRKAEADAERASDRRSQIGTGDRSERIRTYNFPQSRVTDHRIGLTLYQLETVISGRLELLVDPLMAHYRAEALKAEQ